MNVITQHIRQRYRQKVRGEHQRDQVDHSWVDYGGPLRYEGGKEINTFSGPRNVYKTYGSEQWEYCVQYRWW